MKLLYPDTKYAELLADWLVTPASDDAILAWGAFDELVALASTRTGLTVPPGATLADLRDRLLRHVLLAEFRGDLTGPPLGSLATIPMPTGDDLAHCREVAVPYVPIESDTDALLEITQGHPRPDSNGGPPSQQTGVLSR